VHVVAPTTVHVVAPTTAHVVAPTTVHVVPPGTVHVIPSTTLPSTTPATTRAPASALSPTALTGQDLKTGDITIATMSSYDGIRRPCLEVLALSGVPSMSAGRSGSNGRILFSAQLGSYATEQDAARLIAAFANQRVCRYAHGDGTLENLVNVHTYTFADDATAVPSDYTVTDGSANFVGHDS
jgi:hypothetical protein